MILGWENKKSPSPPHGIFNHETHRAMERETISAKTFVSKIYQCLPFSLENTVVKLQLSKCIFTVETVKLQLSTDNYNFTITVSNTGEDCNDCNN